MHCFTREDFEQFQQIRKTVLLNHQLLTEQTALLKELLQMASTSQAAVDALTTKVEGLSTQEATNATNILAINAALQAALADQSAGQQPDLTALTTAVNNAVTGVATEATDIAAGTSEIPTPTTPSTSAA